MTDLFESKDWAGICHSIAVTNGFWDLSPDDLQAFTYRQLCHALSEYGEFVEADPEHSAEELADVAIVLLDLAGAHGVEFEIIPIDVVNNDFDIYEIPLIIGKIANEYRKYNELRIDLFRQIFDSIDYEFFCFYQTDLTKEMEAKCRKNVNRPRKHGLYQYEA